MSFQRRKILRVLLSRGCRIIREGGEHTILGDEQGHTTALPRHREVNRNTARKIARDMEIELEQFLREVR
jgi:predicted RNA binding protein YcfA (HicA-like mRNA interferase family)